MPRTVDEYRELWQSIADGHGGVPPVNEQIVPTSAVVVVSPRSNMAGTGYSFTDDFGDLVGFCRYMLAPMEFEEPEALTEADDVSDMLPGLKMMEEHWEQVKPQIGDDDLARRRAAAESGFDALLADFVREGYHPDMGTRLLDIANSNFLDYELLDVFVLPSDLQRLFKDAGNPLVDWSAEDEAAAIAAAPPFDLNNPEHRARLAEHLQTAG